MKRTVTLLIVISALFLIAPAASKPSVSHTTFYQQNLEHGEKMTFGVQFETEDVEYATANAYRGWENVGYTPLTDRQGDNFFAGSLGPFDGGQSYTVEIKGCNAENECVTVSKDRYVDCQVGMFDSCWR